MKCGNNTCRAALPDDDIIQWFLDGWVEVEEDGVTVSYCGRCAGEILNHD